MIDRDSSQYTLWFTCDGGQGILFGGNYASREAALAAIPAVESEFRDQCNEDNPFDEDGTWDIEPPEDTDDDARP